MPAHLTPAMFHTPLRSAALALAVLAAPMVPSAQPVVKEIRIVEAGGRSGEAVELAYIKPFTARTGIKVVRESPTNLGKLQAMVQSRNISAELVELSGSSVVMARSQGLLEPLDYAAINPAPMYPEARWPDALGYQYFSTIMAWGKDTRKLGSWKDFWNVKDFPGKRALPDYPTYALPIALLADGVKPEELYPLDVDRAFASLQKIKSSVAVWWRAGAQAPQLLEDKEVAYAAAWSGRVIGNPKVEHVYNQGLLELSYFVVPKGADPARKLAAMGLLREMAELKNQIVATTVIPYTGASPALDKAIAKEALINFPTADANKRVQVLVDANWAAQNGKLLEKRWQEFKLGL